MIPKKSDSTILLQIDEEFPEFSINNYDDITKDN